MTLLRVLMVEDSEDDALLLRDILRQGGYDVRAERVDTGEALREALRDGQWDILFADYSLPSFTARDTLAILRASGVDIPAIVVSGTVGEDIAVETLKLGASDYLLKQHLTRLPSAVGQALDQAETQRQRRRLERMKEIILENSLELICTLDMERRFIELSSASHAILGYEPAELAGLPFETLVHAEDEAAVRAEFHAVLGGRRNREIESRLVHKSGRIVDMIWSAALSPADGMVVAVGRDVTERKKQEEALRLSEREVRRERALLRSLIDTIPDHIFFKDRNFELIDYNRTFQDYYRNLGEALIGKTDFGLMPEDWARHYRALDQQVLASGQSMRSEETLPDNDGVVRTFETIRVPFHGPDGELLGLLGVARDVTERKAMEEALREKSALFEAQVESSIAGILVTDSNGGRVMQNQRLNEMLNIPPGIADDPDAARQREFVAAQTRNPAEFIAKVLWLSTHPRETSRDEIELVDGRILTRFSAPVLDREGRHYGRTWIHRDVTEERRREQRLRQAETMEAVGHFASGIAHDFKNMLAVIRINAELIEQEQAPPQAYVPDILHAIARGQDLIEQIIGFARQQHAVLTPMDLRAPVSEAVSLLRGGLTQDIRIEQHLPDQPVMMRGNATQMLRLLLNLGRNAIQAMSGRQPAVLAFALETGTMDAVAASVAPSRRGNPALILAVKDNGPGMAPETVARIFDPSFSTKGTSGSGLGLMLVQNIVALHEGHMRVDSRPGAGTTFTIALPVLAEGDLGDGAADMAPYRGKHILVVDDDARIAAATVSALAGFGYATEMVGDPRIARDRIAAAPGFFDLVITDYRMPGLNGMELAEDVWASQPDLPFVLTGGNGPSADIAHAAGFEAFLPKPFTLQRLQEVCAAVFTAGEEGQAAA